MEKKTKTKINHQRRKNKAGQKWMDDQHSNISEIGTDHTFAMKIGCDINLVKNRILMNFDNFQGYLIS